MKASDTETLVVLENANVAMSYRPLGTVAGVQLLAVFQSPEPGLAFHVALPPKVVLRAKNRGSHIATVINNDGNRRRGRGERTASNIDEERGTEIFIIESFQMTGASPRRCRRETSQRSGRQDLVWGCS